MGTILSETIIGIAAIIVAAALAGVYVSNMDQMASLQKLQVKSFEGEAYYRCKIIHVAGEAGSSSLSMWVKNVGYAPIPLALLNRSDLMIVGSSVYYVIYGSSWTYSLLNDVDSDGKWDPGETLRVDVQAEEPLSRGDYEVIFTLYNGAECRFRFSL
ncbi:MAG TPA: hypothetical protein ENF79_03280 [Nitrososphaeria archaeon]|nr:hypothetical protein [Nitrososphaeria archaeon]